MRPARFSLEGRPIRKVRQSVTRLQQGRLHAPRRARARADARAAARDRARQPLLAARPARARLLDGARRHARARPRRCGLRARLRRRAAARRLRALRAGAGQRRPLALGDAAAARHAQRPDGVPALRDVRVGRARAGSSASRSTSTRSATCCAATRSCPPGSAACASCWRKADRYFQVERLLDFNRKFFPEWEPRYAAFERYSRPPARGARAALDREPGGLAARCCGGSGRMPRRCPPRRSQAARSEPRGSGACTAPSDGLRTLRAMADFAPISSASPCPPRGRSWRRSSTPG